MFFAWNCRKCDQFVRVLDMQSLTRGVKPNAKRFFAMKHLFDIAP